MHIPSLQPYNHFLFSFAFYLWFLYIKHLGNIYEQLIKNKKVNTKLKKYDKIIQKYIKQDVEETKYCSVPIVNTGMNSDIRKFLNKVMYG